MKAAFLAASLLITACGEGPAASSQQPREQSKSPAPAPPQPPAAPVLTPDGYGPLRIGMTLAEVTAALGPDADPGAVGGPEPEHCDEFRPARAPAGMVVMIESGRLARISLVEGAVRTDRALGLGAPASAVRAAYGAALVAEPHEYLAPPAEYLTAWAEGRGPGPAGETSATARGLRYEIGEDAKVRLIHAGGASIQYVEGCL